MLSMFKSNHPSSKQRVNIDDMPLNSIVNDIIPTITKFSLKNKNLVKALDESYAVINISKRETLDFGKGSDIDGKA